MAISSSKIIRSGILQNSPAWLKRKKEERKKRNNVADRFTCTFIAFAMRGITWIISTFDLERYLLHDLTVPKAFYLQIIERIHPWVPLLLPARWIGHEYGVYQHMYTIHPFTEFKCTDIYHYWWFLVCHQGQWNKGGRNISPYRSPVNPLSHRKSPSGRGCREYSGADKTTDQIVYWKDPVISTYIWAMTWLNDTVGDYRWNLYPMAWFSLYMDHFCAIIIESEVFA